MLKDSRGHFGSKAVSLCRLGPLSLWGSGVVFLWSVHFSGQQAALFSFPISFLFAFYQVKKAYHIPTCNFGLSSLSFLFASRTEICHGQLESMLDKSSYLDGLSRSMLVRVGVGADARTVISAINRGTTAFKYL